MQRVLFASVGLCLLLIACQREASAEQAPAKTPDAPATKKAPTAPPPGFVATGAVAEKPAESYMVRIVPGDAKAGQSGTSVVEVTPSPGYKINLEFPSRLRLEPTAGVKPAKEQFGKEDAEVTEKVLRFNVAFTPASAGKLKMAGTADFSVCNDSTCKLIRDEKLAWEVDVK